MEGQKAATRRNMRREERVTVQGPVKEQQPDGMSHRGMEYLIIKWPCYSWVTATGIWSEQVYTQSLPHRPTPSALIAPPPPAATSVRVMQEG